MGLLCNGEALEHRDLLVISIYLLQRENSQQGKVHNGHPRSADLRYGEEDSISPSTQIDDANNSKLEIHTESLHIHHDVPKLARRWSKS